jgi:rare lipoprotein A
MNLTHLLTLVPMLWFVSADGTLPPAGSANAVVEQQEIGLASYYGDDFHGAMTASGKPYDKDELTAAHRTYRFGTRLLITNLRNHRTVVVTVNDRGPIRKDRILDLSYRGAKELHMLRSGVVQVRAEVLP